MPLLWAASIHLGASILISANSYGIASVQRTLAKADEDLYLRSARRARRNPDLRPAAPLRTRGGGLADAVENLPDDEPALALLGTLAFWDLLRGKYPRYVADLLIAERLARPAPPLRDASPGRHVPVAVAVHVNPRTTEAAGALRLMLCERGDGDCNRLLHRPPFRPGVLRRRRRARRPRVVRAGLGPTVRPCTAATWRRASPWDWPPARSGATSTTSTAARRSAR